MQFGRSIYHLWNLDPEITFLNNGSFGATPKKVLEAANEISWRIEREPVNFYMEEYGPMLEKAAAGLASFINCDVEGLALTENATSGVNTVVRSLMPDLKAADEIAVTSHVYPAVKNTALYAQKMTGCGFKEIHIPYPEIEKQQILDILNKELTDKTKLFILDHIASSTGLLFPVKEIADMCHKKNIPLLIDGAHAPGMIPLDLSDIGADWYIGNCHKWLFAAKGCAFIHTAEKWRDKTDPLTISNYYFEGFKEKFMWTGTKHAAEWLSLPTAIEFHKGLGMDNLRKYNMALAAEAMEIIAEALGSVKKPRQEMTANLIALEFKTEKEPGKDSFSIFRNHFYEKYKIEVPVFIFDGRHMIRPSVQAFNEKGDYVKLAKALKESSF